MSYFRLPLGGTTKSEEEYILAWKDLCAKAESFFVGYTWVGFDPDVALRSEVDAHGISDRITLTVKSIVSLSHASVKT